MNAPSAPVGLPESLEEYRKTGALPPLSTPLTEDQVLLLLVIEQAVLDLNRVQESGRPHLALERSSVLLAALRPILHPSPPAALPTATQFPSFGSKFDHGQFPLLHYPPRET